MSYFPQEQLQFMQMHSEHFFRQKTPQNDLNKMTLWSYEPQGKIKKPRIWPVISLCQINSKSWLISVYFLVQFVYF